MPGATGAATRIRRRAALEASNRSERNLFNSSSNNNDRLSSGGTLIRQRKENGGQRRSSDSVALTDSGPLLRLDQRRFSNDEDRGDVQDPWGDAPTNKLLANGNGDGTEVRFLNQHRQGLGDTVTNPDFDPRNGLDRRKAFSKKSLSQISERFVENVSQIKESEPVSRLNKIRKAIGSFVNHDRVQGFILMLIVINAIMMGVATYPVIKQNPTIRSKFELIDQIFLWIFTIEAAMQLIYRGWTLFKDGFLVFDSAIVVISWAMDGAQIARAFRIFRALRLIARIDTMRNLIMAVINVIPNLSAITMLLSLVFYIFGVMFTQLFKDISRVYDREEQYFVSLPETLFTLFQMMTLDGWTKVFYQAYEEYWWSWILFIAFIVVSAFIFVNLIIAVICDAVHVLGDSKMAGLTGYDEDDVREERSRDGLMESPRPKISTSDRLRELEMQLGQIVCIQNELKAAIDIIVQSSQNGSFRHRKHNSDRSLRLGRSKSRSKKLKQRECQDSSSSSTSFRRHSEKKERKHKKSKKKKSKRSLKSSKKSGRSRSPSISPKSLNAAENSSDPPHVPQSATL